MQDLSDKAFIEQTNEKRETRVSPALSHFLKHDHPLGLGEQDMELAGPPAEQDMELPTPQFSVSLLRSTPLATLQPEREADGLFKVHFE